MPDVRLVDLQLIRRYSLAIRQELADAGELLEILESDRDQLQKLLSGRRSAPKRKASPARRATAKGGVKGSSGTTAKKAATRTATSTTTRRTGR